MTLNITEEFAAALTRNGELDIAHLITLYGPDEVLVDYVEQAHRLFALLIYALAAYMLIHVDGSVVYSQARLALRSVLVFFSLKLYLISHLFSCSCSFGFQTRLACSKSLKRVSTTLLGAWLRGQCCTQCC